MYILSILWGSNSKYSKHIWSWTNLPDESKKSVLLKTRRFSKDNKHLVNFSRGDLLGFKVQLDVDYF